MAYIDGYEYDIFISYSHLDNQTPRENAPGWVELFFKNLDIFFDSRYGEDNKIKIWWDKRIEGNTFFGQSIEEGIQKSAIMISLLSPGYMISGYCDKELKLFYNKVLRESVGLKVGDRSRLLNVPLYNIPHQQWPKELSGTTGFPFYSAKNKDGLGVMLDTENHQFREQMSELEESLVNLLEDFKKLKSPAEKPAPISAASTLPTGFPIYFGDVADSLQSIRDRIVFELQNEGYAIVSEVPPPFEKDGHEKAVIEKIEQVELCVHLLDRFPGRKIVGDPGLWYPQKQVELGLQLNKPQLVWLPREIDINAIQEEHYKTFVQSLDSGKHSSEKIDFIKGDSSELTLQIKQMVELIKKQEQTTSEKLTVLLDSHFDDQLYAWEVGRMLLANGIQPILYPVEDDPKQNANVWEERIRKVSKLVFFYGKATWEWVLGRMKEALKPIVENLYPVEEFIVFMVPPHKNPNEIGLKQWVVKVNIVNNSDTPQLDTIALQQFIQDIKA